MDTISLAKDLVAIRSDPPYADESRVLTYLLELFDSLGYKSILQDANGLKDRQNLLVLNQDPENIENKTKKPNGLLFAGHMDVMPPGDLDAWPRKPFEPWIDDEGLLHGRGSTDMKGGIAAFISAFLNNKLLQKSKDSSENGNLVGLLFTVDEETALRGAKTFAESKYAGYFASAIVPEPTALIPVRGHKGVLFTRFITRGLAAHGSVPKKGVNAITLAMELYREIESLFKKERKMHKHPELGPPTMNLGMIKGGVAPNIVPEVCEMELDRRITQGEQAKDILNNYKSAIKSLQSRSEGKLEMEVINHEPPYFLNKENPFLKSILNVTNLPPQVMNGYTEAGIYFNKAGISSIILGPGSIDQAHVADETVPVTQLTEAEKLFSKIIANHMNGAYVGNT